MLCKNITMNVVMNTLTHIDNTAMAKRIDTTGHWTEERFNAEIRRLSIFNDTLIETQFKDIDKSHFRNIPLPDDDIVVLCLVLCSGCQMYMYCIANQYDKTIAAMLSKTNRSFARLLGWMPSQHFKNR